MTRRGNFAYRPSTLEDRERRYGDLDAESHRAKKRRWMPPRTALPRFPDGTRDELLDAELARAAACRRGSECGSLLCPVCLPWLMEAEVCADLKGFNAAIGHEPRPEECTWLTVNLPVEAGTGPRVLQSFRQRWHDFRRRRLPGCVICGGFQVAGYLHCHVVVWHPRLSHKEVENAVRVGFGKWKRSVGVSRTGWYPRFTLFESLRNVLCYAKRPIPKKKDHETWDEYRVNAKLSVTARLRLDSSGFESVRLRVGMSSAKCCWRQDVMYVSGTDEVVNLPEMSAWLRSRRSGTDKGHDELEGTRGARSWQQVKPMLKGKAKGKKSKKRRMRSNAQG